MSEIVDKIAQLSPQQLNELRKRLAGAPAPESAGAAARLEVGGATRPLEFSLLFFSGNGNCSQSNKYDLLLESARFADENGFAAIWTPERHFQAFGGLFPNPAVLGAALAVTTRRVEIRAGSVVLPLHHPIRVAEEWSVVDNLSNGRVGLAFASGYHPGDYVLAPASYSTRKDILFAGIRTFQKLWAGEPVVFPGVNDAEATVQILPKPIRQEIPIWVTSSNSPSTWIKAGEAGFNVLSGAPGLGERPMLDLQQKIGLYRKALADHGHSKEHGKVTIMAHSYVGPDLETVQHKVREPLTDYLRTFISQDAQLTTSGTRLITAEFSQSDQEVIISQALMGLLRSGSLMGTEETCSLFLRRLANMGVDEIACFIDFGLDTPTVLDGMERLNRLRQKFAAPHALFGSRRDGEGGQAS